MKQKYSIKSNALHGYRLSSGAFSLTELIVVIGIVCVLTVLLAGAIHRSGQMGKRTACRNSLRQWAVAMHMYVDTNAQDLPREGHQRPVRGTVQSDSWANVAQPANTNVWYNCLPLQLGKQPASAFAPIGGGIRAQFYRDPLFHCPSAIFEPDAELRATAYFSLVMNSQLIEPPNLTIKMTSIINPSATVLFLDAFASE